MLFRLANWTVMSIAIFYAAEGVGIVERGRYFPTLPRLEERASDPMAWLGAAQWGVQHLTSMAGVEGGSAGGYAFQTLSSPRSGGAGSPQYSVHEALRFGGYYGGG